MAYRNAVYDLWLGNEDTTAPSTVMTAKTKTSQVLKPRQRAILNAFCNGNIQEENVVVHMTNSYYIGMHEHVLQAFEAQVIPALLPHKCPYFNPAKFLGIESTASWVGLLSAHHGLFIPLLQKFCGHKVNPRNLTHPESTGWENLMHKFHVSAEEGHDDIDWEEPTLDPDEAEAIPTSNQFDWHKHCKAKKKKAGMWTEAKPHRAVFILTVCLRPIWFMMQVFMHLSSEEWERQQELAKAKGDRRSFRVLEVWEGKQVSNFMADITSVFHFPSPALPFHCCTDVVRTAMFRMLTRCCSIVHHLLAVPNSGSPFRLFSCMSDPDVLLNTPKCLRDALMNKFLQIYPTAEDILSNPAQHVLTAMAQLFQVDILRIEALHASTRRVISMRSIQTWALAMHQMNAEWLIRQTVILRERFRTMTARGKPPANKSTRKTRKTQMKKNSWWSMECFYFQAFQGPKADRESFQGSQCKISRDEGTKGRRMVNLQKHG